MILVPLFDLKFLNEFAGARVGTSNRRHQRRAAQPYARYAFRRPTL
jgi:hypothetical protein